MTPEVSIVVPVYNNWWLTRRCLNETGALRTISPVRFETIVVDSGSSDETPDRLKEFDWVRTLRLDPRASFGNACNAGARIAEAPIVLFLNNDAYPLGDALTPLHAAFAREEVTVAGAALFYEDGVTQAAGCVLLPNAHWFLSHRSLPADLEGVRRSRDAVVVPGAAVAVRANWFERSGGFDPIYRTGFEDIDLSLRAHSEGLVVRYVAESRFAHYESATVGRFDWEFENEKIFYRRWSAEFATMPRTERGEVSAIMLRKNTADDPVGTAALHDLLGAVRSYGHPVVHDIALWRRFDRRFRIAAGLAWNVDGSAFAPCVELAVRDGRAMLRTHGATDLEVPWMPCAERARADRLWLRRSDEAVCESIAVLGKVSPGLLDRIRERVPQVQFEHVESAALLEHRDRLDVAAALIGQADPYGFGALLVAYGGIACVQADDAVPEHLARLTGDRDERAHAGAEAALDASRRGAPRRSAMRVLDLARVSRFGLERPGRALTNAPIRRTSV